MEQKHENNGRKHNSNKSMAQDQAHMASLLDLQDFLSEELIDQGTAYRRAFVPLTEGLGLTSPRQLTPKIEMNDDEEIIVEGATVKPLPPEVDIINETPPSQEPKTTPAFKISVKSAKNSRSQTRLEVRSHENRLAEVIESSVQKPEDNFFENQVAPPQFEISETQHTQPPPLPRPSMLKRLLAGTIDQVFVLFIWTGMIVITSNLLNNFSTGFSIEVITDFSQPTFQRIAILEFAAAWLGYLGFSLLIFKRTFGMWVWSLGVSYGDSVEDNYLLRKGMRIFWTFIFSAPIVTSVLLAVGKNGRNLLDILSGTNVFDAD